MESFVVGEKVSILDETGVFEVKEILFGKVRIEDEYGFERVIETKFLVKRRTISVELIEKKDNDKLKSSKNEAKSNSIPEIDLHIENLVANESQMSAHEKFTLQIENFKKFTNRMIEKRVARFRVIHGIGEGKLKSEIRLLVNSRVGITMHDDNFVNGKVGASLIEISVTKIKPF